MVWVALLLSTRGYPKPSGSNPYSFAQYRTNVRQSNPTLGRTDRGNTELRLDGVLRSWLLETLHPTSRRDANLHRVDEPLEVGPTVYFDIVGSRDIECSGPDRDDNGLPARYRSGAEQLGKVMLATGQVLPVLSRVVTIEL